MDFKVIPTSVLKGIINCPASKSYSIRAFFIAACGGRSEIIRPSDCNDALVAKEIAGILGASLQTLKNDICKIQGGIRLLQKTKVNVRESGTALRFLLPLLALYDQKAIVEGEKTLIGRPNKFLVKTLQDMGVKVKGTGINHSVPIFFNGGKMNGGKITIDGSLSSQFISALLIACPQLLKDTDLRLTGKQLVSGDYIMMTLAMLQRAGITVHQKSQREYRIRGNQIFKGLGRFIVPSDYGLAAFILAAAALVKSEVTLKGSFDDNFIQADGHIMDFLTRLGVKMKRSSSAISIKGPFLLKGGDFSLRTCPDLVPIMAVLALFAKGRTRLYNISHARAKESDRISDLRKELLKVGADVRETKDELFIYPQKQYHSNQVLDPHADHRLAMAFSVLGLRIGCTVKDIKCSHKSYPQFVEHFQALQR